MNTNLPITVAARLVQLNDLLLANGKNPIKAWKMSRESLELRIKNEMAETKAAIEEDRADDHQEKALKKAEKKPAKKGTDTPSGDKAETVAAWCRANGINAKIARAKLRRAKLVINGRWEITNETLDVLNTLKK